MRNSLLKKSKLFFLLVACSFIQNISLGQSPPPLGATSNFALFTAVGAFDNIGAATVVTGDVGTNVGAFTAFPPGTLIGQRHVADSTSAVAAADVAVAYSNLSGVTCDTVIGTTLGSGQVLTPKVYCLGAASTLNGNLILDGQGDPNALFIFKINGALSTTTFSNVILIDSASLCNVYWQINGAVDLGDSSVFRGTILANGAISLLEGSSLLGRGLSQAGAIHLHDNIVALGMQTTATIIAGGSTILCSGDSITLTASVTNGVGPFSYLWSPGGQTDSSITVSPTINTSYILAVKALNGCSEGLDTINVTVSPGVHVDLGNDTIVCSCIILNAGNPGASYNWSTGENYAMINVCVTGTYFVTVSNGICMDSDTIHVTVNPPPVVHLGNDTTLVSGTLLLDSGIPGASYLWSTGATTQTITVGVSGQYYVKVTDQYGCTGSDTINVNITNGINENTAAYLNVNVSPNPSSDKTLTLSFNIKERTDVEIKIMNVIGKIVYSDKLDNFSGPYVKKIILKDVAGGIYFIDVLDNTRRSSTKIILE